MKVNLSISPSEYYGALYLQSVRITLENGTELDIEEEKPGIITIRGSQCQAMYVKPVTTHQFQVEPQPYKKE